MKPIKVLHILDLEKENYYLNNLCENTNDSDVSFSFITFAAKTEFAQSLENRGKTVHCLNARNRRSYPSAAKKIWNILHAENPDIVHTHLFNPSLIGLTLAKWQGRKTVMTRHHSDLIYRIESRLKRNFYLSLEKYMMGKADRIIAPSQFVRDIMVERQGVKREKISVISYGQSAERYSQISPQSIEHIKKEFGMDKQLSIVYPSRLDHLKGHKYLFEALSPFVSNGLDFKLYLVGTGPYQKELEAMVHQNNLIKNVVFMGWRDDVLAIMSCADIVVQPSLSEALSSVTIEAIMLEKPLVATDVSGVRDSLDNGKYGEIVPPADAERLRQGLKNIMKDIDSARRRAKDGKQYLLMYMGALRTAKEHVSLYSRLTGR